MGDVKEKISVYFLMPDEQPTVESFLRMAYKLHLEDFDDDKFQRIMILTRAQQVCFFSSLGNNGLDLPSVRNFSEWIFAGFMLRTLDGKVI